MRHALFSSLASCQAYQAALDAFYGFPRGSAIWELTFCNPLVNTYAQANPSDPLARWALDISFGNAPAGTNYDDEALFVTPMDPAVLAVVPFPPSATDYDLEPNDAAWRQPE